jgi:hypothetical protein
VPYPFAHPAAVLPLVRPMGRFAVPSALAIGSIVPDLWHFVPLVDRAASHSLAGLVWFCLPAGLLVYVLFHVLLKEPLIALISPRLASFSPRGLPRVAWRAVVVSLLVGALTHLIWDELTHSNSAEGPNWLQHVNTLAGSGVLGWWIAAKLRHAAIPAHAPRLSAFSRTSVLIGLLGVALIAALGSADAPLGRDLAALRHFVRTTGFAALHAFVIGLLVYCALFQRKMP